MKKEFYILKKCRKISYSDIYLRKRKVNKSHNLQFKTSNTEILKLIAKYNKNSAKSQNKTQ